MLVTVPLSIIMMILLWSFYFIAILCSQLFLFSFLVYLPYHKHIVLVSFFFLNNLLKIARSVIVVLANAMKEIPVKCCNFN